MAASMAASGSPAYDSSRQRACSACSTASADRVETGQPRASTPPMRMLVAVPAVREVRGETVAETVASARLGRSAIVAVDIMRELLGVSAWNGRGRSTG
jgi:hypothetical protein